MTIALRGTKFQARLKERGGKYHRYSFDTLEEAQRWHEVAERAIKGGAPVPDPSAIGGDTIQSLADLYRPFLWPDQPEKIIKAQVGILSKLLPANPNDISNRALVRFVEKRRGQGVKDSTIRHYISRLRTLLSHAEKMGDLPTGFVSNLAWPVLGATESRYRFLTVEEEEALLAALPTTDARDLAAFLIDTGCRPGEVMATDAYRAKPFSWDDLSTTKDGKRTLVTLWETKTGKPRTLPLTPRAASILSRRREEGEPSPFAEINHIEFRKNVTETAESLGLKDVVPYTFRHTCATRLVQRGADIRKVKDWMGHGTIDTTMKYAKLTPEDIYGLADFL